MTIKNLRRKAEWTTSGFEANAGGDFDFEDGVLLRAGATEDNALQNVSVEHWGLPSVALNPPVRYRPPSRRRYEGWWSYLEFARSFFDENPHS